jgi:fructosamine-3-kinase
MRDVVSVEPATGGLAAFAGIATRREAPSVFVKAFAETPDDDVFVAEAEGLVALRELGGMATPEVLLAGRELLVLSVLRPRPSSETFWEQFAHALARLHLSTVHSRFGWHRDNWLGRRRQTNTWNDDGFAFFAEHRLLRWLGQPRVEMPIVELRQHLAVLAQFEDDWGSGDQVRATLAPFRTRT